MIHNGRTDAVPERFRPWGARVLVKVIAEDEVTASGIVIMGARKTDTHVTEVVAVGPDCKWVKPGDKVMHVRVVGIAHRFGDGGMYRILHEHELLGVIEPEVAA